MIIEFSSDEIVAILGKYAEKNYGLDLLKEETGDYSVFVGPEQEYRFFPIPEIDDKK